MPLAAHRPGIRGGELCWLVPTAVTQPDEDGAGWQVSRLKGLGGGYWELCGASWTLGKVGGVGSHLTEDCHV